MLETQTPPEWLDVRSQPSVPVFADLAPGSTAEWLAVVTNTADESATLALTVEGDGSPLTGAGGLRLEIQRCIDGWESHQEQRGPYSCAGDTSTVRALSGIDSDETISLPDIGPGETREYLARASLPPGTGNDMQAQEGQIRLNFTSTLGADGPDIPDTGAEPGLMLLLGVLAMVAGLTLRTLPARLGRGSRPPARG